MVERRLPKPVFAGSIPVSRSINRNASYGFFYLIRESNREPREEKRPFCREAIVCGSFSVI